jgi:type II restriction/modification system DNA methylase subunit YeeA
MTPQQFTKKWKASTLKESSASQEHFIDLCRLVGEQTPAEADPDGSWYCFERGARKTGGGEGWADVWRRGCFAWEYKGKHKDLGAAFTQLQRYAIALENPPLLVVSDMDSILIHTNFTNTVQEVHVIPIDQLDATDNVRKLKWLFTEPERLRPGITTAAITEEAAAKFASLADVLRGRGIDPQRVAHFLNRLMFCLFAEDAGLLPPRLVIRLLEAGVKHPDQANEMLRSLFAAMTKGGLFGAELIEWFNGGLFDSDDIVALEPDEIRGILSVARLDWSAIEPSVFGTLFERGLDPAKRSQLGAHYTDPQSIMRIVQPVVVDPLAAEWTATKVEIERALEKVKTLPVAKGRKQASKPAAYQLAEKLYSTFLHRLSEFRVLDPACGSGNFLYLALQALKDLELRVTLEAEQLGLQSAFVGMNVGVQCVRGIELNTYAAELARVTVWIGEIQWMLRHGVPPTKNPILKPLETIERRDAVLNDDGTEARWPDSDAIIGNPPFLGDKKMFGELGTHYVDTLRACYAGRVPGGADLVTYWFEKARAMVESKRAHNVGLVATNSIRQRMNRRVLERIAETGAIFNAWADEPWINEGAAVRVSIVCFALDSRQARFLDGKKVERIGTNLQGETGSGNTSDDLTSAMRLDQNRGICFVGIEKAGKFDVDGALARRWLELPNPNGRPNRDVLRPYRNGKEILRRHLDRWVIDFGTDTPVEVARLYEAPFEHVLAKVKPEREGVRRANHRQIWWRFGEARPGMRKAVSGLRRYIVTPMVAKHRIFAWLPVSVLPDQKLVVIARDDDCSIGVLSSRFHLLWALKQGSTLEDRPTYTSTTIFETFPFPDGMLLNLSPEQYQNSSAGQVAGIAKKLNDLRDVWLNPPDWVERMPENFPELPDRIFPRPGREVDLQKRTLTNLYNSNPTWLRSTHEELDEAVARAYGWKDYEPSMSDDELLSRLLKLNLERAKKGGTLL